MTVDPNDPTEMLDEMNVPAFPTENAHQSGTNRFHYEGMSLRDYFAARALLGLYHMVAAGAHSVDPGDIEGGLAREAYLMADAMLKARQS